MDSIKTATVPCLVGVVELQRECEKLALRLSQETRKYMVYQMLKALGPRQSQKLISKFVQEGIISWSDDFEVESILDHHKDNEDGLTYYLIKWDGWGPEHNTWEPEENLNCEQLLQEYKILVERGLKRKRKISNPKEENAATMKKHRIDELYQKLLESGIMETMSPLDMVTYYKPVKKTAHMKGLLNHLQPKAAKKKKIPKKQLHQEVQAALKSWEEHLNKICHGYDPAPLFVENKIDLEGPPDTFIYINERKEGPGVTLSKDPLIGCDCEDCYQDRKSCCPVASGSALAYYKSTGRLRVPRGIPVYECNDRCRCGPDCLNRVAQKGRRFKLCIFRTHGRGWGVKSLQPIKKGAFVVEYVGEVITNEEAERRGKEYDAVGRTYLFDLDFHDADAPFSVDAGTYGNAAHFINHSCDPNLEVHVVWINTLDPRLPHICLYAKRDIMKNEELTFDYMSGNLMQEHNTSLSELQATDISAEEASGESEDIPLAETSKTDTAETDVFRRPLQPLEDFVDNKKPEASQETLREFIEREKRACHQDVAGKSSNDTIFTKLRDLPTPPCSDTESVTAGSTDGLSKKSRFSMACLCGASNCRKFLFF